MIESHQRFLVTSHQDPDGDSIGSMIGVYRLLKNLGKEAIVINQGKLPKKYKFLDSDSVIRFNPESLEYEPEVAIILDCPNIDRIGFVKQYISNETLQVNIDHHPRNTRFGAFSYVDESACAVAEIMAMIFQYGEYKITPEIAEAFYAGITSDTGRFKFTNTSSKCFETASMLVEAGAKPKEISDKIFSSFSPGTIKLLGNLLSELKLFNDGKICVLQLKKSDLDHYGVETEDTEGIIDYSLVIEGVKVGMLLKEIDEGLIKIGLRSQNGIDISAFARSKGGGGHENAAGFTYTGRLENALNFTVAELTEYLK